MKKKVRIPLFLMMAAIFAVSTTLLISQFGDNASGDDAYGDALAIASGTETQTRADVSATEATEPVKQESVWVPAPVEDDPVMEEMAAIDLAALREVNEDVVGWIRIPDTKIDYPVMQGEDNDYYLKHTWDRRNNSVGSIFLEHLSNPELVDYNTIIYGHNMNNGSMFAGLRKYTTQKYWEEHPYVYIKTDQGVYRYEIFAAYKADVDSVTYGLSFNQTITKVNFLQYALETSKIDTQIIPGKYDRILTLSTCSGSGYTTRWVVQARLKMVEVQQ